MKIWQDSIIAVQLGNRATIVVQNIGFPSGIICQITIIEWKDVGVCKGGDIETIV
jgi:hypothetical protein